MNQQGHHELYNVAKLHVNDLLRLRERSVFSHKAVIVNSNTIIEIPTSHRTIVILSATEGELITLFM